MDLDLDSDRRQLAVRAIGRSLQLPEGAIVRAWVEGDFPAVQRLSEAEGWSTPVERPTQALDAWRHSWPALVAVAHGEVIGFARALGDGAVTTYVAELLVAPAWRRRGIAAALLEGIHRLCPGTRLDLLATATSRAYYEHAGFRLSWLERELEREPGRKRDRTRL